ncbi:MAG: imelysin family protein [Pseudonocardia sp.]
MCRSLPTIAAACPYSSSPRSRGCATDPAATPVQAADAPLRYSAELDAAATTYHAYVVEQADLLRTRTARFVRAVEARDVGTAKSLYASARAPWERIQVAAEDIELDSAIDGSGVGLEPGESFTGFHRLEQDLWVTGLQPDSADVALALQKDVDTLAAGVADLELDGESLCGGAKELLDFAVVTTLDGVENPHSGTDLSDLAARAEGSQAAVETMRPLLTQVDPALLARIDRGFAGLRTVLDTHRSGSGYVAYDQLTPAQLSELAHALDAVGEPVSKLGGTVMV